jgi:threonyl-tRNA synthetase
LVLGEKEAAGDSVALRVRGSREALTLSRPELRARLVQRVRDREFEP